MNSCDFAVIIVHVHHLGTSLAILLPFPRYPRRSIKTLLLFPCDSLRILRSYIFSSSHVRCPPALVLGV